MLRFRRSGFLSGQGVIAVLIWEIGDRVLWVVRAIGFFEWSGGDRCFDLGNRRSGFVGDEGAIAV